MDVVRCQIDGVGQYGVIHGGMIRLLQHPPYGECLYTGAELPLTDATLLPPCEPSKIICIGFNPPKCIIS